MEVMLLGIWVNGQGHKKMGPHFFAFGETGALYVQVATSLTV